MSGYLAIKGISGYISFVCFEELSEGGDAHEALLEEEPSDDGDGDSGQNINDIVVEGVDCRKPDAEAYEGEKPPEPPSAARGASR